MSRSLLRLPEVMRRTGLSRSTIYLRISQGTFPPAIPLGEGARCVAWDSHAIDAWITQTIERAENAA